MNIAWMELRCEMNMDLGIWEKCMSTLYVPDVYYHGITEVVIWTEDPKSEDCTCSPGKSKTWWTHYL